MTQTLPTIPELDVVSDKQYGASFDYIKEGDNRFSSAKGEKQNTVKNVIFDDQESIETRFNIQDVNCKQSTHTIKHKRTPSFISFDDMIHSTKHMEQSNKASYVKKAVGTTATTTHSVEDTAEQAQYPISTVKERVAQWQGKMVRWQGGVEREAADIATKTRNGKDAVGIDDSHREILTTNAAPKTESKNLEFNTKITFEEQELEPVIRKKLLNKVAQHKFNQDIYDASIISYKNLHNYEDLVWLMKKFDI